MRLSTLREERRPGRYIRSTPYTPAADGAMPAGNVSFGDIEKAARVYAINKLTPVMEALKVINEWLGEEVIRFNPYTLLSPEK